jgi:hypothetical protein
MTVDDLFCRYSFHDCNILDMLLNKNELTISFTLCGEYNIEEDGPDDKYFYLKAKFVNLYNLNAQKISPIKVKGKNTKNHIDYIEEECSLDEAWLDGKRNDFQVIDQEGDNGILLQINAIDSSDTYFITFNCEDVQIIEKKLITDEELHKLYDEIENDDTPRIIK